MYRGGAPGSSGPRARAACVGGTDRTCCRGRRSLAGANRGPETVPPHTVSIRMGDGPWATRSLVDVCRHGSCTPHRHRTGSRPRAPEVLPDAPQISAAPAGARRWDVARRGRGPQPGGGRVRSPTHRGARLRAGDRRPGPARSVSGRTGGRAAGRSRVLRCVPAPIAASAGPRQARKADAIMNADSSAPSGVAGGPSHRNSSLMRYQLAVACRRPRIELTPHWILLSMR